MRRSSPPVGMSDDQANIYSIAQYVRMPGDRIEPFLAVLGMCGYEITKRGPQGSAPRADAHDAGVVTAQADPHPTPFPEMEGK